MKRALFSLLSILVAASLSAQVAPNSTLHQDAPQFLIPIVGNVTGATGEHFRTDLTLVNYGTADQLVDVTFIPQIGAPVTKRLTMGYLTYHTYGDVVGQRLDSSGLGALVVTAVNEDGSFDPEAVLDATARIRTNDPRSPGEISSYVGAMTLHGWRNDSPAYIHGTRRTSQFRTNFGIVNLDLQQARRFRVVVNSPLGKFEETIELAAFSMTHRPVLNGWGNLSIYVEPAGTGGPWRAYATSTDNESHSSWVIPAMQPAHDIVFPE